MLIDAGNKISRNAPLSNYFQVITITDKALSTSSELGKALSYIKGLRDYAQLKECRFRWKKAVLVPLGLFQLILSPVSHPAMNVETVNPRAVQYYKVLSFQSQPMDTGAIASENPLFPYIPTAVHLWQMNLSESPHGQHWAYQSMMMANHSSVLTFTRGLHT